MSARSPHLGDRVSAYVDRMLPDALQERLDRHVMICQMCRAVADDERRLQTWLRRTDTPAVPTSLTMALRGLGDPAAAPWPRAAPAPVVTAGRASLMVPPPLRSFAPVAQPVGAARRGARHRPPVRAALLAGLAASASAAAAWGIGSPGVAAAAPAAQLPLRSVTAARSQVGLPAVPPALRLVGVSLPWGRVTAAPTSTASWPIPAAAVLAVSRSGWGLPQGGVSAAQERQYTHE